MLRSGDFSLRRRFDSSRSAEYKIVLSGFSIWRANEREQSHACHEELGVVLVLSISFAGLLSCDCGTEPGPPENGRDTTSHGSDTTSHHFIWTTDTIGDFGSVLYDVAIINDTLAYAVGEIYLEDSTGQIDPQPYGLAIWNGSARQPERLFYGGNKLIVAIRGLVALGSNDVWLAAGSIFHWDEVST